jgi:hypothetical protein
MMLGTQTAMSILWKENAQDYGFPPRPLPSRMQMKFGAEPLNEYVSVKPFKLGTATFTTTEFPLLANGGRFSPGGTRLPVVGMMGMDFFRNVDLELDLKSKHLKLFSQDHCPGTAVYWTGTYTALPMRRGPLGNWYFPLELDGKKIEATMATANTHTTLTTDVTKRLYGFDDSSSDIESETDAAGHVTTRYRAMALTTQGLSVTNVQIQLVRNIAGCRLQQLFQADGAAQYDDSCYGHEAPLQLGLNILQELHLYFATKEKILYVSAADAPPLSPP